MTKIIKGVLITPNKVGTQPRVYEMKYNSYEDFYPLLECETFNIVTRKFNGEYLDIYCDDEGLLKPNNKAAILIDDENGITNGKIVGNVFIVGHNEEGETISLTEEQIKKVMDTVTIIEHRFSLERWIGCVANW